MEHSMEKDVAPNYSSVVMRQRA
ncbi:hypothetical protein JTE90_007018, partial [Oedothorax gibbosus]